MKEFLEQWESSMLVDGKSQKTIQAYLNDITIFLDWIKQVKGINEVTIQTIKNVKKQDLTNFMAYLMQPKEDKRGNKREGNGVSTRVRRGNAIKSFYRFLEDTLEIITVAENPTIKWKLPKLPKREMGFLSEEEAQLLINSVGKRNKTRNTAILILFLNAGLRRQELININVNDLKGNKLQVIGKGDKERTIFISPECLEVINKWLVVREKIKPMSPALFISEQGKRMSENGVYNFIKACMRKIGREDCAVHGLRHTFSCLTLQNGNDIRRLQEALGHSNLNTTARYLHVTDSQKQELANSISKFKVNLDD